MMKTVTLRKEQIYQGDLLLVNARHPYRDNSRKFYVSLNSRYEETLLSREAANALQLIFQKISSGNAIVPVSGYRTLEEQVNIYYVPANNNETTINIEENYVNQISGNNIDGFIVTVWRKNNEQELYGH